MVKYSMKIGVTFENVIVQCVKPGIAGIYDKLL